jgi:hypothetical protein
MTYAQLPQTIRVAGIGPVEVGPALTRYQEITTLDDRQKFWLELGTPWPEDQPGRIFLGRAIDKMGKALFGGDWTGHEPAVNTSLRPLPWTPAFAKPYEKEQAQWLLGRIVEYGRYGPKVAEFTDEEWDEATEKRADLLKELAPIRKRLAETQYALKSAFTGPNAIHTFTRPLPGGYVAKEPLSGDNWLTETWQQRFQFCRIDTRQPFVARLVGSEWLFVDEPALTTLMHKMVAEATPATSARKQREFKAMLLEAVQANERNPHNRKHWQDRAKAEFGIARDDFDLIWSAVMSLVPGTRWDKPGAKPKRVRAE